MSLDRLIDLARRTGDRLIVYDPMTDRDMAILSVDEYERLLLGRKDVRELSESQLLDQINRDIAIWRTNQADEQEDDEEEDFWENSSSWQSAKGVLSQRYPDFPWEESVVQPERVTPSVDNVPDWDDANECEDDMAIESEPIGREDATEEILGRTESPPEITLPTAGGDPLVDEPVFYEEPV